VKRPPAAGREFEPGASGKLVGPFVDGPQFGLVTKGLFEVVADDFVVLFRARLEPVGEPLVQLSAKFLRNRRVRRVADEDVSESEPVVPGKREVSGRMNSLRTRVRRFPGTSFRAS